jgi:hypothetical protein
MRTTTIPALLLACSGAAIAPHSDVGRSGAVCAIGWQRDFARAQASAHETGRPILLLFQEVPG